MEPPRPVLRRSSLAGERLPPGTPEAPTLRALREELLDDGATSFLLALDHRFESRRAQLLRERTRLRQSLLRGERWEPAPAEGQPLAPGWQVPPPPPALEDRRVEITAPAERRMIVHALNSGARVFMADFEDAFSPTWENVLRGQADLTAAVQGTLAVGRSGGGVERIGPTPATLMVRPRGLHLLEEHFSVAGHPISASLFDFGLFAYRNARTLAARGQGPFYYLPKLEHAAEARLWDDVFRFTEERFGLPLGTIRATALIETLPAALEMEAILGALRAHSAGLNGGRWDYIFSFIKQFRDDPAAVFPDRAQLVMTTPFLAAYSREIVRVCHAHGAHAIGGMAANIPNRNDPEANAAALALVTEDKRREVGLGYDGTWVAHPGLVPVARAVFDAAMPTPNQIFRGAEGAPVPHEELLAVPKGAITRSGVRTNARVAVRYLDAWLRGVGCVPIDQRMEDAATVEIARSQLWQWVHHRAPLDEGGAVNAELVRSILHEESERLYAEERDSGVVVDPGRRAESLLTSVVLDSEFTEFLTIRAYEALRLEDPGGGTGTW
jgi:malate synthase